MYDAEAEPRCSRGVLRRLTQAARGFAARRFAVGGTPTVFGAKRGCSSHREPGGLDVSMPTAGGLDARAPVSPRVDPVALHTFNAILPPRPGVHASEGGAAAVDAKRPMFPSLAMLLAGHVLRDGEVVLLILKPSLWYILFSTMRFAAAVLILTIGAALWAQRSSANAGPHYAEAAILLIAGRAMWATLHWMGRLYVLTDQRILRLAGVFTIEIFDCPLRRVAQTRVTRSFRERLWRLGSIEVLPADDTKLPGVWQTVRRPVEVHEEVQDAIRRSKNVGGVGEWAA